MASAGAQMPSLQSLSLNSDSSTVKRASRAPSLAEILSSYPIFENVCQYLDTSSFIALKRVTKCSIHNFSAYSKVRWNINTRLKRFVESPTGLRSQLGLYNAVISGSFALQFFDNVEWEESDLDIYIANGLGGLDAQKLIDYLVAKEGYENEFGETGESYPMDNMVMLFSYVRKQPDGQTTKIQIIATSEIPVLSILKSFATTAVVNVITWNKAFSLFPKSTFIHRKLYFLVDRENYPPETRSQERFIDSFWRHVEKYTSRGWNIVYEDNDHDNPTALEPAKRHIGDSQTWTIPLNTAGVETGTVPDFVMKYTHFSLCNNLEHFSINASILSSMVLKYEYTFDSTAEERSFWTGIRPLLNGLVKAELDRMKVEDKQEFLAAVARRRGFARDPGEDEQPLWDYVFGQNLLQKPTSWSFVDDQLPLLYKIWESGVLKPSLWVMKPNVGLY